MYPENPEGTRETLDTIYIRHCTRTRTHKLFCHKHALIPSGHSGGYSIVEGEFLIEGNYLLSAGLELGLSHIFKECSRRTLNQLNYQAQQKWEDEFFLM